MLENSRRNRQVLAGMAGVTLALALAVSAGAVPRPGDGGPVHTAAVSQVQALGAPSARQPGDAAPATTAPATAPTTKAPAAAATTPTTAAKPRTTTPPTTKAPVAKTTQATPAPTAAPVAPVAAVAAKVARTTPTAAQVQAVITELKRQVGGLLNLVSPTPAQIAQAGDQVCTAFDNGQTFAQVKATGLTMIPASVTVSPATADWAVHQAVTLYCPGHASKLV
jgi:hypothetical protein